MYDCVSINLADLNRNDENQISEPLMLNKFIRQLSNETLG